MIKFKIKQYMKMILQNIILPSVYYFWSVIYWKKEKRLIIFADSHHDRLPFSMERMHTVLEEKGYALVDEIYDFTKMSQFRSACISIAFMKLYVQAKYIFICDNFLPIVSCNKNKETTVIQLWHSCGLIKAIGYDTADDIPKYYRGRVYGNYDIMTVSAPCCVEPISRAMRLPTGILQPVGVSRTDYYFDSEWINKCRTEFYHQYPQAINKKIVLWAPTFRGNAANPFQEGMEAMIQLEKELSDDYFLIFKVHPYIEQKYGFSNCAIPTERLLPVADLMISDYSSILIDFLFFNKPYILFAPDLEGYRESRGFYIDYKSLGKYVVTEPISLRSTIEEALKDEDTEWIENMRKYQVGSCDGKSTDRIIQIIGL